MKTFFCLLFLALTSTAFAQDTTTTVEVDMPCGVAGTPACIFEADTSNLPPPDLSVDDATSSFDSSLISIAGHELTFVFPFQKTSCSVSSESVSMRTGPSLSLPVDYCKAANVFNDIASVIAYVLTAGYLINLAFKPRGE